jgi:hypothetical protein
MSVHNVFTTPVNQRSYGDTPASAPDAEHASVLPPPIDVTGDPQAVLARLLITSAQKSRASEEAAADAEEHAEDLADAERVQALKDKADDTRMAGFIGGGSQALSGAASFAGGMSVGAGSTVTADQCSKRWEGAGQGAAGLGQVFAAAYKYGADAADQRVAQAESDGKVHQRAAETLHREIDAATQHTGKVVELLGEIKQAQAQCEHAALLRMA